jgi:polygalacturonase
MNQFGKLRTVTFLLALTLFSATAAQTKAETRWITEFGARPGGVFLNTNSIQRCIDTIFARGGGYVHIPSGIFLSGTIELRSGVYLVLEAGAVLKGSENMADYTRFDGHRFDKYLYHLVCAKNAVGTGISGEGTIDGNGTSFWEPFNEKDMPFWIKAKDPRVSRMVEFTSCSQVRLAGFSIRNAPEWSLHLYNCKEVFIHGIDIRNHMFGPNADGIDLTGCQEVTISDCHIETCDDGICLKTNPESNSCERITVTNCIIRTSCAALKIGNESALDFRQIIFSNCIVFGSSRAIGLYSEEGGSIEDVQISNIVADNNAPLILTRPIHISLIKPSKGKPGIIRNISIQDFTCKTQGRILLTASKETLMENIQLRNIRLEYPWIEDPFPISDSARSAQYSPQNVDARKQRAAIVAENINNLMLNHVQISWPGKEVPESWRMPKRIENGSKPRTLQPDYRKSRECDLDILYGSNLKGGYLWAPETRASNGSAGVRLEKCSGFTVR